jgi:hypothetical protein
LRKFHHAQLCFSFPLTFQSSPLVHRSNREATVQARQPKRFPPGWFALSLRDPDWQAKHFALWSKRRKALGWPHVVTIGGAA